jgi:hypothetical protein
VFNIMGGIREPGTSSDNAYAVLLLITMFGDMAALPILVAYLILVSFALRERREAAQDEQRAARQS